MKNKIAIIIILLLISNLFSAKKVAGILKSDEVWTLAQSPYIVTDNLTILSNNALTIEPGVKVKFAEDATLIVLGNLWAEGNKKNRIYFQALDKDKKWGGIRIINLSNPYALFIRNSQKKDSKTSKTYKGKPRDYNKQLQYTRGNIISYCIIENVGTYTNFRNERFGNISGAIFCCNTSPVIMNSVLRNNTFFKGGAISCVNYSSPLIKNCTIKDNSSEFSGAGIFCFFFSSPVIVGNIIRENKAMDNGGGINVNNSSPEIYKNAIINNFTAQQGGGLSATASNLKIKYNIFKNNFAAKEGGAIFAEAVKMKLIGNYFDNKGDLEIYLGIKDTNIVSTPDTSFMFDDTTIVHQITDVVATNNYWGTTSLSRVVYQKVFDREDYPSSMKLNIKKIANYPSPQLPYSPKNIRNIEIKNQNLKKKSDSEIYFNREAVISCKASGGLPYYKDIVTLKIKTSESDTKGFHINLEETGLKSKTYETKIFIGEQTNKRQQQIAGEPGENLLISSLRSPDKQIKFKIIE